MNVKVLPYSSFDPESIENDSNSDNYLIIYDRKLNQIEGVELIDTNTFKFLSWKNFFAQKIERKILFLLKKITEDFWYSYFKNSYTDVTIFTEDIEVVEKLFKIPENNVSLILLNSFRKIQIQNFENELIQKTFDYFVDFLNYNSQFIDTYLCIKNENAIVVHIPKTSLSKSSGIPLMNANSSIEMNNNLIEINFSSHLKTEKYTQDSNIIKNIINNCDTSNLTKLSDHVESKTNNSICLSYLFDTNFDYLAFKQSVFLISTQKHCDISNLPSLTLELFENLKAKAKNLDLNINELCTFENFCLYLDSLNSDMVSQIISKTSIDISHFPLIKIKEYKIGDVTFPIELARAFLDHIIQNIRKVFEKAFLFIKSVVLETSYLKGGFLNNEFQVSFSLTGIFDFKVFSDFFITKKEAANDASVKFIEILFNRKVLDRNLDVDESVLSSLPSIRLIFLKTYSTYDINEIKNYYKEYIKMNSTKLKPVSRIVEINNKIQIVEEKLDSLSLSSFKKNFMVDLNSLPKSNETMIGDQSGIPENATDIPENASGLNSLLNSVILNDENNASRSKNKIRKNASIFYQHESLINQLERGYRKIPFCLSVSTNAMSLYTFSNSSTGILCAEAPFKSCTLFNEANQPVQISYNPARVYSDNEIKVLIAYQIIFFKIKNNNLPSKKQTTEFYYYVVPINQEKQIDWMYLNRIYRDFIDNFVYSNFDTQNLIFNPFTSEFLFFKEKCEQSMEDKIGNTTFLDFFENTYNVSLNLKSGQFLFKAFPADEMSSALRKNFNNIYHSQQQSKEKLNRLVTYSILNQNINPHSNVEDSKNSSNDPRTYNACTTINSKLMSDNKHVNSETQMGIEKNQVNSLINFEFLDIKNPSIHSAECCFITPIEKSILVETEIFKRNYKLIEDIFISIELKETFGINVDLVSIIQCFTLKSENPTFNYERLEFIGDSVLKFLSTNHLYLAGYDIDKIVSFKDTIVCNSNLFKCCIESGIFRFLKTCKFNPKMIQAPYLRKSKDLMKYFHALSIFQSDNYVYFGTKSSDIDAVSIKMYADMIEALIGALFLSNGIKESYGFIMKLEILKNVNDSPGDSILTENFLKSVLDQSGIEKSQKDNLNSEVNNDKSILGIENYEERLLKQNTLVNPKIKIDKVSSVFYGLSYFSYEYQNFISLSEISKVEYIIGYKFKNPGNIERAIVHPSYTSYFGCKDFQYLELIGDCSLDLFINFLIIQNNSLDSPLYLHSAKKSYVNNVSLRELFYKYGFDKCTKLNILNKPNSKAYSDVIEAIIGAIVIDVQWDYNHFVEIMSINFKAMLENCKSEFNLD